MTFAELQRGVFDDLQYQAQPKPGVQDRVRRYLNEGLERVLRRPRLKQLRLGSMPLTSVPDQGFYGLAMGLERIDYVIDLTNRRPLAMRTRDWYRHLDPTERTTGTPSVWIPEGIVSVMRQPRPNPVTGETDLYVSSGSAADTTQIARVRVSQSFVGNVFDKLVTLQGTTPVPFVAPVTALPDPTTISWFSLDRFAASHVYLSDVPVIAVPSDIVAVIPPGTYSARHVGIRFYPTPSAVAGYEIEGQRVIPKMMFDEDEPPFSADFHEMLQCYARGRFYRKDGRLAQSQQEMAEFERYCLDLTAHVEYPVGYKPVAGKLSPGTHGWSDLGPWYPADRGVG